MKGMVDNCVTEVCFWVCRWEDEAKRVGFRGFDCNFGCPIWVFWSHWLSWLLSWLRFPLLLRISCSLFSAVVYVCSFHLKCPSLKPVKSEHILTDIAQIFESAISTGKISRAGILIRNLPPFFCSNVHRCGKRRTCKRKGSLGSFVTSLSVHPRHWETQHLQKYMHIYNLSLCAHFTLSQSFGD